MVSLKQLVKCLGLPVRATFKLLHLAAFALLHLVMYEGLKFQFVHFPAVYRTLYADSPLYYVRPPQPAAPAPHARL